MAIEKIQPSSGMLQSSGADWRDAEQLGHRQIEDAERIGLADAQMDAQRRGRHHPAVEAGLGDRMTTIKERQIEPSRDSPRVP